VAERTQAAQEKKQEDLDFFREAFHERDRTRERRIA
jgi:hypothetical protein